MVASRLTDRSVQLREDGRLPRLGEPFRQEKQLRLTGQSGAGTDYQVKLIIAKSAVNGEDFDLGGNCRDDFYDIRFYDNDRRTRLPHWIESVAGGIATAWVKVADDLSSGTVDIYLRYDWPGAPDASDGKNTFKFFDGFGSVTKKFDADNAASASIATTGYLGENIVYDSVTEKYWWVFTDANVSPNTVGIAWATSLSGSWTVEATDIISEGSYHCMAPCLVKFGDWWYIYYGRVNDSTNVGDVYAQRCDTVNGTYVTTGITNPIVPHGAASAWDEQRAVEPYVFEDQGNYYCFYMGEDTDANNYEKVGYATSSVPTGSFSKYGSNPVLSGHPDASGSWDSGYDKAADPFVFEHGGKFYVGISCTRTGKVNPRYILLFETEDFVTYVNCQNPLLGPGVAANWDDGCTIRGAVSKFNGILYLPYTGNDGSNWRMGLTTLSPQKTVNDELDGSKWIYEDEYSGDVTVTVASGVLEVTGDDSWDHGIATEVTYTGGYALRGRVKYPGTNSYWGFTSDPTDPSASPNQAMIKRHSGATNFYLHVGDGVDQAYTESSTVKDADFHVVEIRRTATTCEGVIDDSDAWNEDTYAANDAKNLCVSSKHSSVGTEVDWMCLRKFVATEPSYASVVETGRIDHLR